LKWRNSSHNKRVSEGDQFTRGGLKTPEISLETKNGGFKRGRGGDRGSDQQKNLRGEACKEMDGIFQAAPSESNHRGGGRLRDRGLGRKRKNTAILSESIGRKVQRFVFLKEGEVPGGRGRRKSR